jgi:hypothetical protein
MKHTFVALLLLLPTFAHAEAGWLTAPGRLDPGLTVSGFVGTRTVGLGATHADDEQARAALGGELAYSFVDRFVEARGARVWQLNPTGVATASVTAGGSAYFVAGAPFDVGLGPQLGLNLGLGSEAVQFELGLRTGAELFARGTLRFPERGVLGVSVHLGPVRVSLLACLGIDVEPGHAAPWRGEAVLAFGWLQHPRP